MPKLSLELNSLSTTKCRNLITPEIVIKFPFLIDYLLVNKLKFKLIFLVMHFIRQVFFRG